MKLIVTGSRDWPFEGLVWDALDTFTEFPMLKGDSVTIVHGHCPKGADHFADRWFENEVYHRLRIRRYPAQWNLFGNSAGPIRNEEMVNHNLDADYVLAFPLEGSRGTKHCMEYARSQGLTVINLGERID